MKDFYLHHHLGLGDHIICNGLVRNLEKKYNKLYLFVKKNNFIIISFMYRDLNNLELISVNDDNDVYKKISYEKVYRLGFENLPIIINKHKCGWDEAFYIQSQIPFEQRWRSFDVVPDKDSQLCLYEKLNPNDEKFCLVHSSGSDNIERINNNHINSSLKRIEVSKNHTENIFDYLTLIEKASEIHCIDSSFLHLVDSVNTDATLFFHKNSKIRNPLEKHTQNKNWKII